MIVRDAARFGSKIGLVFAFLTEVLSVTSVRGSCSRPPALKVDRQKRPEENRQSIERAVDRCSGSRNPECLA